MTFAGESRGASWRHNGLMGYGSNKAPPLQTKWLPHIRGRSTVDCPSRTCRYPAGCVEITAEVSPAKVFTDQRDSSMLQRTFSGESCGSTRKLNHDNILHPSLNTDQAERCRSTPSVRRNTGTQCQRLPCPSRATRAVIEHKRSFAGESQIDALHAPTSISASH